MLFFTKSRLPSKFVFNQKSSSMKGCLPSKAISHQRLSLIEGHLSSKDFFINGHLLPKVIFHKMSPTKEGHLSLKAFFHQWFYHTRLSSIKGRLPSKIVFHQRSSSINGRFPLKVVFHHVKSMCKIQDLQFSSIWQMLVRVIVLLVTGGKKSTPSPKTEVWTLDWSLTTERTLNQFYQKEVYYRLEIFHIDSSYRGYLSMQHLSW